MRGHTVDAYFVRLLCIANHTDGAIQMDDATAAVLTFVLNYMAYLCEISRGGIQSISRGQYEGAKVLGFTYAQTMRKIILPQNV